MLKITFSRVAAAILAAKNPPSEGRGDWRIGERAGNRYAVRVKEKPYRITASMRCSFLVCLQEGANKITAAELADLYGTDRPMQQFFSDLENLEKMEVAPVIDDRIGKPFHILTTIKHGRNDVSWTWADEYLIEVGKAVGKNGKPVGPQTIKYPKKGLRVNLKKHVLAPMIMLALAEQFTRCNGATNACSISVINALRFCGIDMENARTKRNWLRVREHLNKSLKILGVDGDVPSEWNKFKNHVIVFSGLFPKRRKKKAKKHAGSAIQNAQLDAKTWELDAKARELDARSNGRGFKTRGLTGVNNPPIASSFLMQARRAAESAAACKVKNQ